ncbi:MAG TPA: class I SAM-dependent methyltransferase [Candidatus Polarisedimenticolaceae bacterium]|nr:class I SAM-dependent methyltransferase [Candidatus Polarisedimenticolaceae bacterium]
MTSYDVFAKFYDEIIGNKSSRVSFLQKLIEENTPNASNLLEIACGTGTLIQGLSKKYRVAGFDLSSGMVGEAREKLPGVDIRIGNMADFDFGESFDVVLCVYDSINHLLSWGQWCALLANAHKHLNPGGLFIFDIHTPERHEWLIGSPPRSRPIGDDHMFMAASREGDKFKWTLRVFQKEDDGRFSLHEDFIYETAFPIEDVEHEVSKLFTVKKIVDDRGLDEGNPDWRPFFVCVKK